jgi:competence protein ComEC
LWHEGVRRIDEVILSHADLDHFNGVPALLERFAIGRVTTTPSFSDKQSPGVELVLARLERAGVPMRIVSQGDRLTAGAVSLEVLHPPADGPDGTENARSLVLELRHGPHTMLLTGDLEGPGLAALLAQPPRPVDVLMAPHHGSPAANVPALAEWARPRLVIASTGPVRRLNRVPDPYQDRGAVVISTSEHGAIHLRSSAGQLTATTFVTRHQWQVTP